MEGVRRSWDAGGYRLCILPDNDGRRKETMGEVGERPERRGREEEKMCVC